LLRQENTAKGQGKKGKSGKVTTRGKEGDLTNHTPLAERRATKGAGFTVRITERTFGGPDAGPHESQHTKTKEEKKGKIDGTKKD